MGDGVVSAWRGLFRRVAREALQRVTTSQLSPDCYSKIWQGPRKCRGSAVGTAWGGGARAYWGQTPGQTLGTNPMKYPHVADVENQDQRENE